MILHVQAPPPHFGNSHSLATLGGQGDTSVVIHPQGEDPVPALGIFPCPS